MDTNPIFNKSQGASAASAAAPIAQVASGLRPEEAAPGFQALLEKLEKSAGILANREVDSPDHLAGALDEARATLQDALDLGRDLIEAYRQAHVTAK
ncbi:MAG: hypothetical protein P1V81_14250 [Planctomycetota bacterium]|nr:hypothetical protein [Planctomycetota bacterium]